MGTILVTGAAGQIGSELVRALREKYGQSNVIASDIRPQEGEKNFEELNVLDSQRLQEIIERNRVEQIYHLAALLSAVAEKNPLKAWEVNVQGSINVLESARKLRVKKVFIPSSIAAFGPTTPLDNTPQDTIQRPTAIYGITKVAIELLGDYYSQRFGVDCRGVRYPGIISYLTPPGGGTTDYAIEMMVAAIKGEDYTCYLRPDTSLDMMFMPDAIRACLQLMDADQNQLQHRNSFNVTAFQMTPERLERELRDYFPKFRCKYQPDPVRQKIADSWPNSMDDSAARKEWGWNPKYDFKTTVKIMLENLPKYLHKF